MYRDERDRLESEENHAYSARAQYTRYDRDRSYEEDRNRTSSSYRDSLESSLERSASRTRLERADDARYRCYRDTAVGEETNYDRFLESKHRRSEGGRRRTRTMIAVFLLIAFVAVIAVTMSVISVSEPTIVETQPMVVESLAANAEGALLADVNASAAETIVETVAVGGDKYIMLKSGELVAIEIPAQSFVTAEEEKGFDKLCSWLNGVFGG